QEPVAVDDNVVVPLVAEALNGVHTARMRQEPAQGKRSSGVERVGEPLVPLQAVGVAARPIALMSAVGSDPGAVDEVRRFLLLPLGTRAADVGPGVTPAEMVGGDGALHVSPPPPARAAQT